jgi:23S rRNA pseudouridine2605 synthase
MSADPARDLGAWERLLQSAKLGRLGHARPPRPPSALFERRYSLSMPKKSSSARRPVKPASTKGGKPAHKSAGGRPAGKPSAGKSSAGAPRKKHPKRTTPAPPRDPEAAGGERLQKLLSAAGIASRREAEQLILEGRIQVDGEVVRELGTRVDRMKQEIRVDGEPLPRPRLAYFAVNKPVGIVSTMNDPSGRPRVIDLLPPSLGRLYNVGRLDLGSEGLILVTNDGDLANRLTHPRHGVEKTYHVEVAGSPDREVLAQLEKGVYLAEGKAKVVSARVKTQRKQSTILEIVLDEGRNREIRRILARMGHKVVRLIRIAVGPVRLGDMPAGAYRRLTQEEVEKLREASGDPTARGGRKGAPKKRAPRKAPKKE